MKRRVIGSVCAVAVVGSLLMGASGAVAQEVGADEEARAIFDALAPAEIASAAVDGTVSRSADAIATIADDAISVANENGKITLSAPEETGSTDTVPVLMADGSALFGLILRDKSAPDEYSFDFDAPAGTKANLEEDGSVRFEAADGSFIGGLSTPWARDANEYEVPTWFSLVDGSIVQHVDTSGVPESAFPVVADPWLGQSLVASAWVTNQGGSSYVVHAVATEWGRKNSGTATHSEHVKDLKTKLGSNAYRVTATIDNQFICHVFWNNFGGGATYSMESWRPNVHWSLQGNPATKCNP